MTAIALQMAMVAAAVADGGVIMTPHVMEQIRDSQGNLVAAYHPSRGCGHHLAPDRGGRDHAHAGGGHHRHGDKVRLPAQLGRGGQDRNGRDRCGPTHSYTNDWLIAFAPAGNPKVAIAVVVPNQPAVPPAPVSGPDRAILGDVLAAMMP